MSCSSPLTPNYLAPPPSLLSCSSPLTPCQVVGSTHQQLSTPNMATYIGRGKLAEVKQAVAALNVDTVVFDDELSAGQLRNLEKALNGEGQDGNQGPPVRVSRAAG